MTKTTKQPDHDRTPENTPIPGGGSWQWDAAQGAWVSLEQSSAPFADTVPQDKE